MSVMVKMPPIIQLLEDDVPGAKLDTEHLEKYPVSVLQRWLECRGLKKGGTKAALIKRIVDHVGNGESHILDPSLGCGKPLEAKRQRIELNNLHANEDVLKKPVVPFPLSSGWRTFPGYQIPTMFNEGHVYHYLVETMPALYVQGKTLTMQESGDEDVSDTDECVPGAEKLFMRAKRLLDSTYVKDILDFKDDKYYHVKCFVQASMRLHQYPVILTMSSYSGSVLDASCSCVASAGGRCSHVASLLLYISKHVLDHGHEAVTSTGRPREWGKGTLRRDPGPTVRQHYYQKWNVTRRQVFDPRPTSAKFTDLEEKPNIIDNFLKDLMCVTDTKKQSVFVDMMPFHYQDFDISDENKIVVQSLRAQYLEGLWSNLKVPGSVEPMLVTSQQNEQTWLYRRCHILTASIAKEACQMTVNGHLNFLRRHLWVLEKFLGNRHTRYGQEHEKIARMSLQSILRESDHSAVIQETGLWVSQKYPWLGCSPYGIVISAVEQLYAIEIKCPSTLKDHDPNEFEKCLTEKQQKQFPLMINDEGLIELKKSHSHYYQIQMVMAVMNMQKCVYFVWSHKGHVKLEIHFDNEFWSLKRHILREFHFHILIPEYFLMRAPRMLQPIAVP